MNLGDMRTGILEGLEGGEKRGGCSNEVMISKFSKIESNNINNIK